MRPDMNKIAVERPRHKSVEKRRGGDRRSVRAKLKSDPEGFDTPSRGPSRHPRDRTKELNEYLKPLYRFLESRVGHLWNKVYAEMVQAVPKTNTINLHIYSHIRDAVKLNVAFEPDGTVLSKPGRDSWGSFSELSFEQLYVNKSGILVRYRRNRPVPRKRVFQVIVIDETTRFFKERGIWYRLTMAPKPSPHWTVYEKGTDAEYGLWVYPEYRDQLVWSNDGYEQTQRTHYPPESKSKAARRWGPYSWQDRVLIYGSKDTYCIQKRQMTSKELRKHNLKND